MTSGFAVSLGGERRFVADGEPTRAPLPRLDGMDSDDQVIGWIAGLWSKTVEAREPEIERLRMLELLYRGHHYRDAYANRTLDITNLCFSKVETVVPALTIQRPRPEVVGRHKSIDSGRAERIQEFATYLMDRGRTDKTWRLNTRVKAKYGYCIHLITIDENSGMPYLVDWSPFDFYPDTAARNVLNAGYFFLAGPVETRRLKSMFPAFKDKIKPDNFTSPMYDVMVRADEDLYHDRSSRGAYRPRDIFGPHASAAGDPASTTGTRFTMTANDEDQSRGSETTFLIQFLVRDYGLQKAYYAGDIHEPPPPGSDEPVVVPGQYYEKEEPCCPSGWRLFTLLPDGTKIQEAPVDPCFGGLPFVIGQHYEHESRINAMGEIDQIAPLNRSINETKNALHKALKLSSTPVLVSSKGSGIKFDAAGVMPGDVLEPTRGSDLKWLEYRGPGAEHYQLIAMDQKDIDDVSGLFAANAGDNPPGARSGTMLRALQGAGDTRIRGHEQSALEERAEVVRKMLHVAHKKLSGPLMFKASGGEMMSIAPDDLIDDFDIQFVQGTGLQKSQEDIAEEALALYQMELITPREVLKQRRYPNYERVAAETMAWQIAKAVSAARETAQNANRPTSNGPAQGPAGNRSGAAARR